MNSRLFSIIRKEFIQILRDPRTLAMILFIPVMQLFLLGYAATTDVKNIPLAVYDQSRSPESRALLDAFRAADYFRIAYDVGSEAELRDLIERGEARAALIIPPDYSQRLLEGNAQVAMVLDGSDSTVGTTALSTARLIGQAQATKIMQEQAARSGRSAEFKPPLEVRTQVWYNPDLVSAHFMIPGVIGMILFAITSILTATTIVRERERGTIEQLIVTPIRSWELIVGKLIPYVVWRARAWRPGSHHRAFGIAVTLRPGDWPVRFHHRQHPAGSHDDHLDDPTACHFPVWLPVSA